MLDLEPGPLKEVREILAAHAGDCEVRVFGSRIQGKAGPFSDLDLVLVASGPIPWRHLEKIKTAFSESDLPFKVDVLDWQAIPKNFKDKILEHYEVLQMPSPKNTL